MTPGEATRWAALVVVCALLLTGFIYGLLWLPGPDANPRCHGRVQSVHNGPGDHKIIVCVDGSFHRLNG